jgi:hypothetical protein
MLMGALGGGSGVCEGVRSLSPFGTPLAVSISKTSFRVPFTVTSCPTPPMASMTQPSYPWQGL